MSFHPHHSLKIRGREAVWKWWVWWITISAIVSSGAGPCNMIHWSRWGGSTGRTQNRRWHRLPYNVWRATLRFFMHKYSSLKKCNHAAGGLCSAVPTLWLNGSVQSAFCWEQHLSFQRNEDQRWPCAVWFLISVSRQQCELTKPAGSIRLGLQCSSGELLKGSRRGQHRKQWHPADNETIQCSSLKTSGLSSRRSHVGVYCDSDMRNKYSPCWGNTFYKSLIFHLICLISR